MNKTPREPIFRPPTNPEKETFDLVMSLIKKHNSNPNCPDKLRVDSNVRLKVRTARFDFIHIPESKELLGEDTVVMAVTMFDDQVKSDKAMPQKDFRKMMRHIEEVVGDLTGDYTDTGIRHGYYECMYFKGREGTQLQKDWEFVLKCHRTFLIYYKDVEQLVHRFRCISEKRVFESNWGVEDILIVLNMPEHDQDYTIQSYV